MLTAAVTLAMATSTARVAAAAAGSNAASSCDEAALDREYDLCVALLHTGKDTQTDENEKIQMNISSLITYIAPFCKHSKHWLLANRDVTNFRVN